ncbi:hypothetical protein AAFC00_005012 [Neodothiora populina]|uniref:Copper-fist domain-containing protein n=1 Tax=Neodothiora populina TaxID=2781224 RepID=A0ABR3P3X6_9PEZI
MVAMKKEDNPTDAVKVPAGKDLITLRNARNGEVYKFACKTCIDGHRAPLCDPRKHRGKIMFRRPAPGRPARQCGHPKSAQCDCLSKRTLCCVLTNEQWDQVEQRQVISVQMYDTREDLDAAQNRRSISYAPSSVYSDHDTSLTNNGSVSSVSTPLSTPLNVFGSDSRANDGTPVSDSYPWPAETPPAAIFGVNPHFPSDPPARNLSQSDTQFAASNALYRPPNSNTRIDMARNGILQQSPSQMSWLQPRPEYMSYQQPHSVPVHDAHFGALGLEQMHLDPGVMPNQTNQDFLTQNLQGQFATVNQMPQYFQPVPMTHDFTLDADLSLQAQFDPAQPPAAMENLSQSCCSSKRARPQVNMFFPASAPTQQFPCPRCASTMCTCTNCPEVMQDVGRGGAWSRACGRDGHLDAQDFITAVQTLPQMQATQSMPPPALRPAAKSCCGGGGGGGGSRNSDSSGPSTTQASPYLPAMTEASSFAQSANGVAPQWSAMQQQQQQHHPTQMSPQDLMFGNDPMLDPQMLYQMPPQQDPGWGGGMG